MRILVTGASGFVGSLLIPRLLSEGHTVRALGRDPARVQRRCKKPLRERRRRRTSRCSAATRSQARGSSGRSHEVDVAYYLIHSMEPVRAGESSPFRRARASSRHDNFRRKQPRSGRARIVYLGGLLPRERPASRHLASREQVRAHPARRDPRLGRPARLDRDRRALALVSLSRPPGRAPAGAHAARLALLPHPADRRARRDRDARSPRRRNVAAAGRSLDIGGPDVLTYGEMISRIAELMLVRRPVLGFGVNLTPVAARVAAAIAAEDPELILPLMESLPRRPAPRECTRRRGCGRAARRRAALLRLRRRARAGSVGAEPSRWPRDER